MPTEQLREALEEFLINWQEDVPAPWRQVLADVKPDFQGVRSDLILRETDVIFPGRKGQSLTGAPTGAHIFKSLARLSPGKVKAVVIGQDPYPRVSRATGRAFEQGDLSGWTGPENTVTTSMKRLLQVASHERTGETAYLGNGGWSRVVNDLSGGNLNFLPPQAQFDAWEDAGVLWLNAGLTLSYYQQGGAPEQAFGHIPLWRPIIQQIIRHLVRRPDRTVVFLTWGAFAQNVLTSVGVDEEASWGVWAGAAEYPHPATAGFLAPPNPLAKANSVLSGLGGDPIVW